jgi:hypothetical protein
LPKPGKLRENLDCSLFISSFRRVKPQELDEEHLKKGWTADTVEAGVVESHVVGNKWTGIQVFDSVFRVDTND